MVYLLFRGEAPTRTQAAVLELLAVALASADRATPPFTPPCAGAWADRRRRGR
jgi:hypothetical protein